MLKSVSRNRAVVAGLAEELYRREHGRAPTVLAELVPGYLAAVPRDPYVPAAPLHYEAGRLWSVGPDLQDDHGKAPPYDDPRSKNIFWWSTTRGDLVLLPNE